MADTATTTKAKPLFPGKGVDFFTASREQHTGELRFNWFDHPLETHSSGCRTGNEAAVRLMAWLSGDIEAEREFCLQSICLDAVAALHEKSQARIDRSGAAIGFFATLQEMLLALAQSGQWRAVGAEVLGRNAMLIHEKAADDAGAIMRTIKELGLQASEPAAPTRRPTRNKSRKAVQA